MLVGHQRGLAMLSDICCFVALLEHAAYLCNFCCGAVLHFASLCVVFAAMLHMCV